MPEMEQQEVPAAWWDAEADRSLLAGVFKHGGLLSIQAHYIYAFGGEALLWPLFTFGVHNQLHNDNMFKLQVARSGKYLKDGK